MDRALLKIAVGFMCLHFTLSVAIPVFTDEAYYALWARHLAWGYYDHPPMVAYMIALGVSLFGENPIGIRAAMVLVMGVGTYLVGDTAKRMKPGGTAGIWAAILFNFGMLPMALGTFATPDVPSMFFWTLAVWLSIRAVENSFASWWIAAGVAMGLGVLSKFTNGFLCIGLLGWLLSSKSGRAQMLSIRPYAALLAFGVVLAPYVLWNMSLDWVGFERQGSRLADNDSTRIYLLGTIALLLLLPTPLVMFFAVRQVITRSGYHLALLLWSLAPLMVFFLYQSFTAEINANWPAPLQAGIAVLAGAFLAGRAKTATITAAVAGVMSVGLVGVLFNPFIPISTTNNPPNQVRGWGDARAELTEIFEVEQVTWIATLDYGTTGMMAYQFPDLPVWSLSELDRYLFRPPFPQDLCSAQGALIERSQSAQLDVADQFAVTGMPSTVTRSQAGYTLQTYVVTPIRGPLGSELCDGTR